MSEAVTKLVGTITRRGEVYEFRPSNGYSARKIRATLKRGQSNLAELAVVNRP